MTTPATEPPVDPAAEHLARRAIWDRKYAIRSCYRGWYERMRPFIVAGPSLEIGAGSGNFKSYWPSLLITDIVKTPYVDVVANGMQLPLRTGSLGNLVVIDLLHHLADPHDFFDEAARVLRPGGRILIIEPYITPVSYIAYRAMHHEDVWFGGYLKSGPGKSPWEGNMAIPNFLFAREAHHWARRHPTLTFMRKQRFSVFDFQLAGGFKPYTFIKQPRLYDLFRALDRSLDWLAWLCGFRIFCVIENRRL